MNFRDSLTPQCETLEPLAKTQLGRLEQEKQAIEERLKKINRAIELLQKYPEIEELMNCLS